MRVGQRRAADIAFYADIAGATPVAPAAVADVIAALLNAPQMLYRVEHGTDDGQAVAALSAFELASRLSFHYWQAPPDDELWNAAQSGALSQAAAYEAQLERLIKSPQSRPALDEFVTQWQPEPGGIRDPGRMPPLQYGSPRSKRSPDGGAAEDRGPGADVQVQAFSVTRLQISLHQIVLAITARVLPYEVGGAGLSHLGLVRRLWGSTYVLRQTMAVHLMCTPTYEGSCRNLGAPPKTP